jgi:hypothetical protein
MSVEQVDAIISEALAAGYFERTVDGGLPEGDDLREAASELVRQAQLSYAAGNRMEGVLRLLHIAEVELGRDDSTEGSNNMASDVDLTKQSDDLLKKLETTLMEYPPGEEVEQNLAMVRAEMERRGIAVAGENGNGAAVAPESAPESVAEIPVPVSDERTELENRLTFAIMRKHGIDPSEVPSLSVESLRWIVDHPDGESPAQAGKVTEPSAPPAEPSETIETTRMVVDAPQSESAPVTPVVRETTASGLSLEREEMESQVAGPMLKAYGIGRQDIPNLGDNELKFMLEHPDGRVTEEQLEAARALDRGDAAAVEEKKPEAVPPTIAEQKRAAKEASSDEAFAPSSAEEAAPEPKVSTPEPTVEAPAPVRIPKRTLREGLPENPAAAVIAKEQFPVPPEIDEEPPRLPFDLSKCSDAEVASYHAQFHACQVRADYVVGLYEGELRDVVKLRRGREVHVANNLPQRDGRVKLTDQQREAMVQADEEVVSLREQEHAIERVLRQLRALAEGYAKDVSTCSRQWSMRKGEALGSGGLR